MTRFHQLYLLSYIILWSHVVSALPPTTPNAVNISSIDSNNSSLDRHSQNGQPGGPPPNGPPPNGPPPNRPPSGGSSSSSSSTTIINCFSGDTLITLANGKHIPIDQLRTGDKLLSLDESKLISSEMIMMLDKHMSMMSTFHTITTVSGHRISLTSLHLIPIVTNNNKLKYIPGKDVKCGDILYVLSNGNLVQSLVVSIKLEMKRGYFAPLLMSGTLLANDILASCYANVQSHEKAHFYMAPLRWYYQSARLIMITNPFGNQIVDGIHFIPQLMYNFVRWFRPSTLMIA